MGSDVQRCSASVHDRSGMSTIVRVCRMVDMLTPLRSGMNGAIASFNIAFETFQTSSYSQITIFPRIWGMLRVTKLFLLMNKNSTLSSLRSLGWVVVCFGLLTLPITLPIVIYQIGYQIYFHDVTGRYDLSVLKMPSFGASKSVKMCAESLKQASYAKDVHLEGNDLVKFEVDYMFTLNNRPSELGQVEWGKEGIATWSWASKYVDNDVRGRCQGPVTVDYSYSFVKNRFHGSTVIAKP